MFSHWIRSWPNEAIFAVHKDFLVVFVFAFILNGLFLHITIKNWSNHMESLYLDQFLYWYFLDDWGTNLILTTTMILVPQIFCSGYSGSGSPMTILWMALVPNKTVTCCYRSRQKMYLFSKNFLNLLLLLRRIS